MSASDHTDCEREAEPCRNDGVALNSAAQHLQLAIVGTVFARSSRTRRLLGSGRHWIKLSFGLTNRSKPTDNCCCIMTSQVCFISSSSRRRLFVEELQSDCNSSVALHQASESYRLPLLPATSERIVDHLALGKTEVNVPSTLRI